LIEEVRALHVTMEDTDGQVLSAFFSAVRLALVAAEQKQFP
jgi:hypothetical protein